MDSYSSHSILKNIYDETSCHSIKEIYVNNHKSVTRKTSDRIKYTKIFLIVHNKSDMNQILIYKMRNKCRVLNKKSLSDIKVEDKSNISSNIIYNDTDDKESELNKIQNSSKFRILSQYEENHFARNSFHCKRLDYVLNFRSETMVNSAKSETFSNFSKDQRAKVKVYRCQIGGKEESCCCACNSDAMFEVMKSLYDCYNRKNCDTCNCILCGHLPNEERRLGEMRKTRGKLVEKGISAVSKKEKTNTKEEKLKKAEGAGIFTPLEGKTREQREKILRDMAMAGVPLPEGNTASEKEIIAKVKKELGTAPEPKTASGKDRYRKALDADLITPLEGKAPTKKLKKKKSALPIPSEKLRKAKEAGLVTPLEGKTPAEKEKILKGLAMAGIPLPEGKTESERMLVKKVRADLGLPSEPKTPSTKEKYDKAFTAGLIVPLEGKTKSEKERVLKNLVESGIPLPEGRTKSEISLIKKIKLEAGLPPSVKIPSAKLKSAKKAGLLTPLAGKPPEEKEKILKGLVKSGLPLPEPKTQSEKELIEKVRQDLGLPPEPQTASMKIKMDKATAAGLITPLEGKTDAQKEKTLRGLTAAGIPLPEGRTASEKEVIQKIKTQAGVQPSKKVPSSKLKAAKKAGLLTPIEGKTPEEKEKILRGLVKSGIPLPDGKTASEKALIDKVRQDMGLPPEAKTPAAKEKMQKAHADGLITPLEGKSPSKKEKILKNLAKAGIALPEGRTASEKALIDKVRASEGIPPTAKIPSAEVKAAKAASLLTPLEGKTPSQKEKILRGLVQSGIPLPEGKTASEKALIDKVKRDMAPPPEGKVKQKIKTQAGVQPSKKVPSSKLKAAKKAGLLTPLEGKTPEEKEKILRDQVKTGIPLPDGKTASEKALIDKVRQDMGLPPEAKTPAAKEKMQKAHADGLITPLEGKSPSKKEKILKNLAKAGIALPEGRTASEKALIDKVRASEGIPPTAKIPSAEVKAAKAASLLTPLEGKTPSQKEKILRGLVQSGIPLPEGKTASEKALIDKVKRDMALPPEGKVMQNIKTQAGVQPSKKVPSTKLKAPKKAGLLTPLEGKTPEEKEKILRGLVKSGIPLPDGKTASEKALIDKVRQDMGLPPEAKTPAAKEKMQKAHADGLITPLEGKTPSKKEKILRNLAKAGIALPEGRTASEKALIDKVRASEGISPTAKIPSAEVKAAVSEKTLIEKVKAKAGVPPSIKVPSANLRSAKKAGLLTPLEGKTPKQKEKILKGLAQHGIPLPKGKTASEKALIDKVRMDMGLPPEAKTPSARAKIQKAFADGLVTPLEGKTPSQKEKVLKNLFNAGIPLPEGRTASEKALIDKVRGIEGVPPSAKMHEGKTPSQKEKIKGVPPSAKIPSSKLKAAKAAGLLTPLEGKTPSQKENILKGLALNGIPLPEGKSVSEKKLIEKIRKDVGLPPEPRTPSQKEKMQKAQAAGLVTPLEGKTPSKKKKILKDLAAAGIPLPEGRSVSEKALIAQVMAEAVIPPTVKVPSEKLSLCQKEKIFRGLAMQGIPLPKGKTASEQLLIDMVRKDLGRPPKPGTRSQKEKMQKAQAASLTPVEGKTSSKKLNIPKGQAEAVIPSEEARKLDEKTAKKVIEGKGPVDECICGLLTPNSALIAQVKAETGIPPSVKVPSEKLRAAKAAGLLTPLEGKSPEKKEKILRGLAMQGIPLPKGKTASEQKIIDKVRKDLGLPPEPRTRSEKEKMQKAQAVGLVTPLEGKTPSKKKKVLKDLAAAGIPLPEGRTASEKDLIAQVKAEAGIPPSDEVPSKKPGAPKAAGLLTPLEGKTPEQKEKTLQQKPPSVKEPSKKPGAAKAAGLLTPLEGKTPEQKEKILRGLAMQGIPLPEGKTASERKIIDKVREDLGLPPEPRTRSEKEKMQKAKAAGLVTPLEGKTPSKKKKILQGLADAGIPMPEGRTASEKALIAQVKAEAGIPPSDEVPSKKPGAPKAAGLLTPLEGKTPEQKEKTLQQKPPSVKEPSKKPGAAKAAGLLTPLEGKTPEQKEKILRGLAMQGIPLPEGKTASERKIIDKVREDLGLPPEPRTRSEKEKMQKAKAAGLVTPLEGKTLSKKKKILQGLADTGIPMPEGRTASEKALIAQVKAEAGIPPSDEVPSKKPGAPKAAGLLMPLEVKTPEQKEKTLQQKPPSVKVPSKKPGAAKAAGLLTPLEGKTPEQKEKILRGLAMQGIPLPEGKTASERKIIDKVREDLGLPPEPRTRSEKEKMQKAKAAGLVTPLEGKTLSKKKKILQGLADAGIPMPEGRTTSEKALIAQVKAEAGIPPSDEVPSKKPGAPKAAGLLTPLEGKTPEQKEKTLQQKPPSVKVPSKKPGAAKAAGLLTPLEGKTPERKEKTLQGLALKGNSLPEGKIVSEQKIIDKVRKDPGLLPEPQTGSEKEKMEKAKASGLVSPLEGKTPSKKKKVLKDSAAAGIPLPEGRMAPEKALIAQVKSDTGIPPSVKVASEKPGAAKAAGLIKGKTPEQKEKILQQKPLSVKVPSKKPGATKAAGLLTPLEGKTPEQKEKISRGLAMQGIPLPEGKTASEQKIIKKVREDPGLPPEPRTRSEKEKMQKAKAAGLVTPLEGKTGKTPSEIKMKTEARKAAGLPIEPTRSEKKGEIRTRAKGIGVTPSKKIVKGAGITAEYEDIIKTTTCDRACGCDKKKIRFKHSYIKIRVTSPDISSLCSCPDECLPGVKNGVFTDDEGIKVTVGTALLCTSSEVINNWYNNDLSDQTEYNITDKNYLIDNDRDEKCLNLLKSSFSYSNEEMVVQYGNKETPSLTFMFYPKNSYLINNKSSISVISGDVKDNGSKFDISENSYDSMLAIKTESSLSLRTESDIESSINQDIFLSQTDFETSQEQLTKAISKTLSDDLLKGLNVASSGSSFTNSSTSPEKLNTELNIATIITNLIKKYRNPLVLNVTISDIRFNKIKYLNTDDMFCYDEHMKYIMNTIPYSNIDNSQLYSDILQNYDMDGSSSDVILYISTDDEEDSDSNMSAMSLYATESYSDTGIQLMPKVGCCNTSRIPIKNDEKDINSKHDISSNKYTDTTTRPCCCADKIIEKAMQAKQSKQQESSGINTQMQCVTSAIPVYVTLSSQPLTNQLRCAQRHCFKDIPVGTSTGVQTSRHLRVRICEDNEQDLADARKIVIPEKCEKKIVGMKLRFNKRKPPAPPTPVPCDRYFNPFNFKRTIPIGTFEMDPCLGCMPPPAQEKESKVTCVSR